jgi:hypothetical protein
VGIVAVVVVAALAWLRAATPASAKDVVEVWKSPTCGCCVAWAEHMERAGFRVKTHDTDDLVAVMSREGVPFELGSCHTATVGGYVIEGHVPADLVKRLLRERPAAIKGLAVPGMVNGSPGMEGNGPAQHYRVIAFGEDGSATVYAER